MYRTDMQRPPADWRRRGCIVVVCIYIFKYFIFNMQFSLVLYFQCIVLSAFVNIHEKYSQNVCFVFVCLVAILFYLARNGEGAVDHFGTILGYFFNSLNKKHENHLTNVFSTCFCLVAVCFTWPGMGMGQGTILGILHIFLQFMFDFYKMSSYAFKIIYSFIVHRYYLFIVY